MTTLLQEFNTNGLVAWWDERYATQDFNNHGEYGRDFGRFPLGTPIASISSGRVVYAQQMNSDPGSSVGYIVQVENADGSLFHYQHLRSTSLQVGDYVHAGDLIGLSGGCPANGYGTQGCRYTDQYTTGPHIEVRYAPHYDPSRGAWGQHWVNPETAFAAYGSQSLTGNMIGSLGIAGNAANAVQSVGGFGADFANALAAGLSGGLRSAGTSFVAPAEDFTIRGFLIGFGVILAGVGLFLLGQEAPPVQNAKRVAGEAIGAEVGSQTAQAIVPAFGTNKRIREAPQPRATVTESRPAQPQVQSAPQQKALPAPSRKAIEDADAAAVDAQNLRLLQDKEAKRKAREAREADTALQEKEAKRKAREADMARLLADTLEAISGSVREVKPPDSPKADTDSQTRAKQILKRIQAGDDERQSRRLRNIGRRKA